MTDQTDTEALVEARARKICVAFKVDPDEITDPYGPVRQWHLAAYHIGEAIEATAQAAQIAALTERVRVLEGGLNQIGRNEYDDFAGDPGRWATQIALATLASKEPKP